MRWVPVVNGSTNSLSNCEIRVVRVCLGGPDSLSSPPNAIVHIHRARSVDTAFDVDTRSPIDIR